MELNNCGKVELEKEWKGKKLGLKSGGNCRNLQGFGRTFGPGMDRSRDRIGPEHLEFCQGSVLGSVPP